MTDWTLQLKLALILWATIAVAATLAGYLQNGLTGALLAYAGTGSLAGIMLGFQAGRTAAPR